MTQARQGKYPCMACKRFICDLGEVNCEECEYGHLAEHCPHRIDVSTYDKESYIHGPCHEGPCEGLDMWCEWHKQNSCGMDHTKPVLVLVDPELYEQLRVLIVANGATRIKQLIDLIREKEGV